MASRNAAVVASFQRVPARSTRSEPSNRDIWSPHIGCAMSTTSYFSSVIGEHRFSFQQLLDSALDHEFLDLVAPIVFGDLITGAVALASLWIGHVALRLDHTPTSGLTQVAGVVPSPCAR